MKDLRTMKNNRIILLDVGGTFIKSSLGVACKGALEGTFMSTPMSSDGTAEEITDSFREAVSAQTRRAAEEGFTIDAVCAAIPGPFNYKEGIFLMKHKFAAVYGKSFREILGEVITPDTRLAFAHDVNGALLGAIMADPSLKEGVVAMCTLGTGLGFAHAIQGQVQESEMGSPARNIWNQPYLDSIVEDYASRRAILRFYAENGGVLAEGEDVKEIAMRARAGEENAADAFRQAGRHLAAGAAELVKELGVRYILFGGQISRSFDLMEEEVRKGLPAGVQISVSPDIQGMVLIGASSLV